MGNSKNKRASTGGENRKKRGKKTDVGWCSGWSTAVVLYYSSSHFSLFPIIGNTTREEEEEGRKRGQYDDADDGDGEGGGRKNSGQLIGATRDVLKKRQANDGRGKREGRLIVGVQIVFLNSVLHFHKTILSITAGGLVLP